MWTQRPVPENTEDKKVTDDPTIPTLKKEESVDVVVSMPTTITFLADTEEILTTNVKYYSENHPLLAVVEFQIGEKKKVRTAATIVSSLTGISIISVKPNNIIDFEFQKMINGIGKFRMTLFDESGYDIEEKIVKNKGTIKFRYGYNNEYNMSPWYTGKVLNYTIDFQTNGSIINFSGLSLGWEMNSNKTFKGFNANQKISDIVKEIGKQYDFTDETMIVEPTKSVQTRDDIEKTELINKAFLQKGETSLQFILKTLRQYAINKDGQGDYVCYFEEVNNKSILHFHTKWYGELEDDKKKRVPAFTQFKSKNSPVLNFRPNWSVSMLQIYGSGSQFTPSFDADTKEFDIDFKHLQQDAQGTVSKAPKSNIEDLLPLTKEGTVKEELLNTFSVTAEAFRTTNEAKAASANTFSGYYAGALGGTLDIIGTTNIGLINKIAVIIYQNHLKTALSPKMVHWISGYFRVTKIVDKIKLGSFTTSLDLITDGRAAVLQDKIKTDNG